MSLTDLFLFRGTTRIWTQCKGCAILSVTATAITIHMPLALVGYIAWVALSKL